MKINKVRFLLVIISFVLILSSFGVIESHAAMQSYMSVNNADVGNILGEVTESGDKTDRHSVYEIHHQIEIPTDVNTGLPTGSRKHHPFIVTTKINRGLPFFYQALTNGSPSTVEIDYYRITDTGAEEKYFTVRLEDVIILNIQHDKLNVLNPENEPYPDMVSLSFSYSKITWIYHEYNIVISDDWKSPMS